MAGVQLRSKTVAGDTRTTSWAAIVAAVLSLTGLVLAVVAAFLADPLWLGVAGVASFQGILWAILAVGDQ